MTLLDLFRKAFQAVTLGDVTLPGLWHLAKGLARGTFYILWYRSTRRNVVIRFPFMAYAPVRIYGKGSVFIDERCSVFYSVFRGLTIMTLTPEARVSIGKGCDLGGLTIRCCKEVSLGDKVMTAVSLVQDTPIVHDGATPARHPGANWCKPVSIGDKVWLAASSAVLQGASIGEESVLSVGSCIMGQAAPGRSLLVGNPVRRPVLIERILGLRKNA
ncbi:MAG TPA: hypothetical protein PLS81_09970 [Deltaproteobacteria bacterium]|nr:hypothetical protein [Deltaproteobacteria bacterium]HPP81652.1 hypothetical protein [Deltaproteobacteria bacterium]